MPNPECNALTYVPPAGGAKAQILMRSLPSATGQVTTFAFPWSGPALTVNVPPSDNLPPLAQDKPYTGG